MEVLDLCVDLSLEVGLDLDVPERVLLLPLLLCPVRLVPPLELSVPVSESLYVSVDVDDGCVEGDVRGGCRGQVGGQRGNLRLRQVLDPRLVRNLEPSEHKRTRLDPNPKELRNSTLKDADRTGAGGRGKGRWKQG